MATRTASPKSGTACHLCVPGCLSRMAPSEVATWPLRRRRQRRWTVVSAARFTRRLRRPFRLRRRRRAASSRWLINRRWSPATVRDRVIGINLLVARHRRLASDKLRDKLRAEDKARRRMNQQGERIVGDAASTATSEKLGWYSIIYAIVLFCDTKDKSFVICSHFQKLNN